MPGPNSFCVCGVQPLNTTPTPPAEPQAARKLLGVGTVEERDAEEADPFVCPLQGTEEGRTAMVITKTSRHNPTAMNARCWKREGIFRPYHNKKATHHGHSEQARLDAISSFTFYQYFSGISVDA